MKRMSIFDYDVTNSEKYLRRINKCRSEVETHNLIADLWLGDEPVYENDAVVELPRMSESERLNIYNGVLIMALRGDKTARKIFCDGVSSNLISTIPGQRFSTSDGLALRIYDAEDSCAGYQDCFTQCVKCTVSFPPIKSDEDLEAWMHTLSSENLDTVTTFLYNLWYEAFMVPYKMEGGKYIENRAEPVCPELYRIW